MSAGGKKKKSPECISELKRNDLGISCRLGLAMPVGPSYFLYPSIDLVSARSFSQLQGREIITIDLGYLSM